MAAVCEIRSDDDLALAIEAQTEIVQISAANITQALRWIKKVPSETIVIFEANTASALKKVSGKVDAIIAGPRVLKINNLSKSIERLMGKRKPLVKFCGVRSWQQALACQKMGIDFIGLNFIPSDPRRISYQLAQQIIQKMKEHKKSGIQFVGVFQDQDLSEVNTAAEKLGLDFIQLSGRELISYIKKCKRPVIKEISLTRISSLNTASRYSAVCKYIALNSFRPSLNHRALKKCSFPYLLGGNISPDQMKELQSSSLLGFNLSTDLARSELDFKKVKQALL